MFDEEEINEESKHIFLNVLGDDGITIKFKFLKNYPLKKLMNAYCDRNRLNRHEARFIYRNARIFDDDTPNSLRMKSGDLIDVSRIFGNNMTSRIKDEATSSDEKFINLTFMNEGTKVEFRVKENDPFNKMMNVYCNIAKVDKKEIRFFFEGARINDIDTPATFKMEDGDSVDIFQKQESG